MSNARDFSSLLSGGLQGGSAGGGLLVGMKAAGMVPGPWTPWILGGGVALGALGSLMGSKADEEEMKNDPVYQAAQRRERGLSMFRKNVGRALGSSMPKDFGGMLNGTP